MENYQYNITNIQFKNTFSMKPNQINVFVGANNCGKTQLLKDMLSYITGQKNDFILLDKLDVTYPENWETLQKRYKFQIVKDRHGNDLLRHISPMLDGSPSLSIISDLNNTLNNWLKCNRQQFRNATGSGFVTFLNTDNRLKLAMSQSVKNLQKEGAKNVLESLYESGKEATQKVRQIIMDIFNLDIYLDTSNLGMLQFKIGIDFSKISDNSQIAYSQLNHYPLLDIQGDGIRSAIGIISAIIAVKKPVILLDEPEAFLHPPQAIKLGGVISKLVDDTQQIFISTHSVDFLKGLLGSTREATIIHLNRKLNDEIEVKVLNSDILNSIITDPLLSSSRVLEGMFYKGVVATEGDADTTFYQRLFQKVNSSDEIHFVNAHNKQTLKKLIEPYKILGIKFAMIADIDVIRDIHEFKSLINISSDEQLKKQIINDRNIIYNFFHNQNKHKTLCKLYEETKKLTSEQLPSVDADSNEIDSRISEFRLSLKKIREESDELANLKKDGYYSLREDLQKTCENLLINCASIGLFIVKVGELESWLIDYGIQRTFNKSKWISSALNKLYEIEYDETKEIWKFIIELKNYLIS